MRATTRSSTWDTVEALVDAGHTGAKIVEQPVAMSQRTAGEASSGTLTSIWHVVRVLIAMELMHKRRPRAPLASRVPAIERLASRT